LNIAVVTEFFLPNVRGGVEQYSFHFAVQMALRGHEVDVYTSASDYIVGGLKAYPFKLRAVGRLGLRRLKFSPRYDVISVQNFSRHLYPFLLPSAQGRIVLTPHGALVGPLIERDLSVAFWLKFLADSVYDRFVSPALLKRATRIVALSELERSFLVDALGVDRGKTCCVAAGVPDELFFSQPRATERLSWLEGSKYVLSVGRVDVRKAVDHVVRALEFVDSDVHFVFAGQDRGFASHVLNIAAGLGVRQRVHYLGVVDDAEKAYLIDRSMALVLPSKWEMQPTIVLEAMALGRPVIATNVGANVELLAHGKRGFLFSYGDLKSLATYISQMSGDRWLPEEMGREGRSYAWGHHRWSKIASDLETVLTE
jgi:glycosyltransferase involved in cell wall biosynthesis